MEEFLGFLTSHNEAAGMKNWQVALVLVAVVGIVVLVAKL